MLRRFAWLLVSAPLALLALPALAQDAGTTVVRKTPSATGALPTQQPPSVQPEPVQTSPEAATQPKDQLRPAQDVDEAPPPASARARRGPAVRRGARLRHGGGRAGRDQSQSDR